MMRDRIFTYLLLFWMCFLGHSGTALAEADVPTRITSERLQYSHRLNQIEFIGQVQVDRPGFEMRSDTLIVFLQSVPRDRGDNPGEPDKGQEAQVEVEKMIAQGNVYMKHDGRIGRSDAATYWTDREVLRLEGNAVVEDGPTKLEGNVITLDVREKDLDVEGRSERRVEGMFFLPQEPRP